MEELTIEQKAKAYDEALERARKELHICGSIDCDATRQIFRFFPELKESEDEKIRKSLLEYLHTLPNHYAHNGVCAPEWIAWLEEQVPVHLSHDDEIMIRQLTEYFTTGKGLQNTNDTVVEWLTDIKRKLEKQGKQKSIDDLTQQEAMDIAVGKCFEQGEQKTTDKVEPKFKVRDWVVDKNGIVKQILSYKDGVYRHTDGYSATIFEDEWRMWDIIQDAKDGDILVTMDDERPFIYKGCLDSNHPDSPVAYCGINSEGHFQIGGDKFATWWTDRKVQPATKEQCDTLLKAMANAGYTFDFEKKELKKIEQSSTWSKEDKQYFNFLEKLLENLQVKSTENEIKKGTVNNSEYYYKVIQWLKSIKDRYTWKSDKTLK